MKVALNVFNPFGFFEVCSLINALLPAFDFQAPCPEFELTDDFVDQAASNFLRCHLSSLKE